MTTKKPYLQRSDIEKLNTQWYKLSGLHSREEWSAAVIRAATAAEIAANHAIRQEFRAQSQLDPKFVDDLLWWANGLRGKIERLLLPMTRSDATKHASLKTLLGLAKQVNKKRNAIAHSGEFCNKKEATAAIDHARQFVTVLMQIYEPEFQLKERNVKSET